MKPILTHSLLLVCLAVLISSTAHGDEEADLIAVLQSSAGIPQKCAACQRLRFVGTTKSVPALSALLGEERTGHAARYALEGMPYPEAGLALRQALEKTSGLIKAGLVDSVGWRRDVAAVPLITPLLTGGDPTLASAAAAALGRIGGKQAVAALVAARDSAPAGVKPIILDSLLQCAERLLARGDAPGAVSIYLGLDTTNPPARIRTEAWRGLVMARPDARAGLVTQALIGRDDEIRIMALKTIRELNDPQVVKSCLSQWTSLPADAQLAVLDASPILGLEAQSALRTASKNQHSAVRIAAWRALGDLGDASSVPALANAAAEGEAAERAAARDALAQIRGPGVRAAILGQIDTAEPLARAELLRALGERGDKTAVDVLLKNAGTEAAPIRLAALASLQRLALAETITPLLDLAARSKSDDQREPVLKALYAVCQASPDKAQTSRRVVEAIGRFAVAERRQVLPLLAELGTSDALASALAAARDRDSELAKEAVRTLAQWPNAAAASPLLELARASTDTTLHTLALRGGIEVAALEPDLTKRLALLQQAMAAARRSDEKKQALGQIGQIPTRDALQVTLKELSEPALADEASLATVGIAEKLASSDATLADEVAVKVLAHCNVPDVVRRAWALRRKPQGTAPFIRDWVVAGPYSQAGADGALAVFNIPFAPEKAGERVQWKPMPQTDQANLSALFPDRANCAAYLRSKIVVAEDCEGVLLLGSDDGVKAWLNGEVVHSNNVDRGQVPDQDAAPIQLKKGANLLMLKVTQGGGGWSACARIVGADGRALPGFRTERPEAVASPGPR